MPVVQVGLSKEDVAAFCDNLKQSLLERMDCGETVEIEDAAYFDEGQKCARNEIMFRVCLARQAISV